MGHACAVAVRPVFARIFIIFGLLLAFAALPQAPALAQSDGQTIQSSPDVTTEPDPGQVTPTPDQVTRVCQTLGTCGDQRCGGSCCGTCCGTCGDGNCGGGGHSYCPAGSSSWDGYCLPDCPPGFGRYPGYPGLCLPPCHPGCPEGYVPVPLPQCPPGYHRDLRDLNNCVSDPVPPTQCPQGMNFSITDNRCQPTCPAGMYLGSDQMCHNYYEDQCLQGYQRDPETGACIPTGDWPPGTQFICLPVCPEGWTRDIYHPTRCLPPRPRCEDGFDLWHDQCLPECEQGAVRNDYGYCVPPQCPDGTFTNLRGECQPIGCPQGYETIGGQCYEPCREGYNRNPNDPSRCEPPPPPPPPPTDCGQGKFFNPLTQACERNPPKCKRDEIWDPKAKACLRKQRPLPPCPEGSFRNNQGICIPTVRQTPQCGPNEVWSASLKSCITRQVIEPRDCGPGKIWSRKAKGCVRNPNLLEIPGLNLNPGVLKVPKLERVCPPGRVPDGKGHCVTPQLNNDLGTAPIIKLQKKPNGLKLQGCPEGTMPDGQGGCVKIPQ
jgi:hypothetical protein